MAGNGPHQQVIKTMVNLVYNFHQDFYFLNSIHVGHSEFTPHKKVKLGNIPKDDKNHGHAPMYLPPVPFRKPEKTQKPINKDESKTVILKINPSDESKDSPTIDKKV